MGYASHKIGYEGYIVSNDVIVTDPTEYTQLAGGYATKITGDVLSDVSDVSRLRFKATLKHSQVGHNVEIRVYMGDNLVWYKKFTGTAYTTFTEDVTVNWARRDGIKVRMQASANSGYMKDFTICGKISPLRLD